VQWGFNGWCKGRTPPKNERERERERRERERERERRGEEKSDQ
jgi:hypothetical protein